MSKYYIPPFYYYTEISFPPPWLEKKCERQYNIAIEEMIALTIEELPKILREDTDIVHWAGWLHMSESSQKMLVEAEVIDDLISLIEDDDLRGFTYFLLSQAHPDFWIIPSSSSGKYHPAWENGKGGLIRHIKGVGAFALSSMRRYGYGCDVPGMDPNNIAGMRDMLIFSVLLHDWGKNGHPKTGWGKHTTKTHGEDTAKIIEEEMLPKFLKIFPEIKNQEYLTEMVKQATVAISEHYALWSTKKIRPTDPTISDLSKILAEGDYMASRKFVKEIDIEAMKMIFAENSPMYVKRIITTDQK
jgi:hypothetical protein